MLLVLNYYGEVRRVSNVCNAAGLKLLWRFCTSDTIWKIGWGHTVRNFSFCDVPISLMDSCAWKAKHIKGGKILILSVWASEMDLTTSMVFPLVVCRPIGKFRSNWSSPCSDNWELFIRNWVSSGINIHSEESRYLEMEGPLPVVNLFSLQPGTI